MPAITLNPAAAAAAPNILYGQPETAVQHPAGKSLKTLRDRLILELGRRTDIPTSLWNEWINDAYYDLWTSLSLPEATRSFGLTMAVDQPLYLLPSTVDTVRTVSATDAVDNELTASLEKIDLFSYRKLPVRSGEPQSWFREQQLLVIWPTPDKEYPLTVDAKFKPAAMWSDEHFPVLEDKWHEALYRGAKYRAWDAVQNDTKAALNINEMNRLVQRRKDRDSADSEDEYPSVRPVFSRRDIQSLRRSARGVEPGE